MRRPTWPGLLRDAFGATALDDDVLKDARRHHRRRAVQAVDAVPGHLHGTIDDGAERHHVHWQVEPLGEAEWHDVEQDVLDSPLLTAALLDRRTAAGIPGADDVAAVLLPDPMELAASCGCEDWLVPCLHALAIGLALAALTREDLWLLLRLRGRSHDWLVAAEAAVRARRTLARHRLLACHDAPMPG